MKTGAPLHPNYNICLVPGPVDSAAFVEAAQAYASCADGYCLSDSIHPHITLCQIYIRNPTPLPARLEHVIAPESVNLTAARLRAGRSGYIWLEIGVEKSPALMACKADIDTLISALNLRPFTPSGGAYAPHITLCRALTEPALPAMKARAMPCTLAFGKSDANGRLLSIDWMQPRGHAAA